MWSASGRDYERQSRSSNLACFVVTLDGCKVQTSSEIGTMYGYSNEIGSFSWIHAQTQSVFSSLSHMRISIFEVMSVFPIDRSQNTIPRAMLLHGLKKV